MLLIPELTLGFTRKYHRIKFVEINLCEVLLKIICLFSASEIKLGEKRENRKGGFMGLEG